MARKKLIKLHKVKCIRSLFVAIICSQRKHTGHWWLRTSIKLLRNSLINFQRLAAFAGVSIASLLSANSILAENPKLSSKLFLDLDEDGYLDLIDASINEDDLIRTEIYPGSNSNNYNYVNGPNFDADLVGAVEDDLILLQKSTGEYAFLKNNGSENFSVAQSGYIGSPVNEAVLSDFDQDGDDDVVFATPGAIGWLKNDGTDGFATQETLVDGLPNDVHSLDISDNDYDGDSEIKFRYEGISGMLKNEGTEGFSIDHSYDSYEDFHIHQHDLNDDGTPEAITVKENGLVGISKSNGTEGFETQYLDLDNEVDSSFLNDLDDDGDDDLVFTTPTGGIGWAKNEGSDGFVAQQNLLFQGSSAIEVIEIDDFDHDGDNDILFTQNGLPGYGILQNDGSENFVPELSDTDTSLVYEDINDDGIDDVISVKQSGLVGINQSQGSEGFNAQLLDIDNEIDSIHLADLDSDGDDDLVFATPSGGIGWAKNDGSDGFALQARGNCFINRIHYQIKEFMIWIFWIMIMTGIKILFLIVYYPFNTLTIRVIMLTSKMVSGFSQPFFKTMVPKVLQLSKMIQGINHLVLRKLQSLNSMIH